jgi:hypothetical protein
MEMADRTLPDPLEPRGDLGRSAALPATWGMEMWLRPPACVRAPRQSDVTDGQPGRDPGDPTEEKGKDPMGRDRRAGESYPDPRGMQGGLLGLILTGARL